MHAWVMDREEYSKMLVKQRKSLYNVQNVIQQGRLKMKILAMIIVVLTITSCSKTFEPNDLLDPTTTIVKTILKGNK